MRENNTKRIPWGRNRVDGKKRREARGRKEEEKVAGSTLETQISGAGMMESDSEQTPPPPSSGTEMEKWAERKRRDEMKEESQA